MSWQGLPSQAKAVSYGGSGLQEEPPLRRGSWVVRFEVGFCQACKTQKDVEISAASDFLCPPISGRGGSDYMPNCPTVHKVNILFTQFVFITREKLSQLGPTSLMAKALWVLGTVIPPERS